MSIKTRFVCSSCGYESGKWLGRCPECSTWNSFSEIKIEEPGGPKRKGSVLFDVSSSSSPQSIEKIKSANLSRIPTGFSEFDRVLGGGIVPGSVILLSGDPGIGKSTLLLELAVNVAQKTQKTQTVRKLRKPDSRTIRISDSSGVPTRRHSESSEFSENRVLYISGEESESQIKLRAERIETKDVSTLLLLSTGNIDATVKAAYDTKPDLLIVDSIQSMATEELPGFPGSIPQIRHATSRLVSFAKKNHVPVFIIGHVTKEGVVAGPMLLSHMVDCVLYFEGSASAGALPSAESGTRILRSFKNRFGDVSEVGLFTMEETGLSEVKSPAFFMDRKNQNVPGSCLTVVMEGSRPIIVEIQALIAPSTLSFPRRVSAGISITRLELLLAVIQKHIKIPVERMDVYINVAGGLRITETATDLAVILAVISSYKNKPLGDTFAISEVGLLGELKGVLNQKARIKEASKLGGKKIITPESGKFLSGIIKNLYG